MIENTSHWASLQGLVNEALQPSWVAGEDKTRLAAYDLYEAVYWTAPESFQLTMRGQEGQPIFVPSGRKIVDTAHQYMAPQMRIIEDPAFGTDGERENAKLFMTEFARREALYGKFSAAKRHGIMRGDWVWHIYAEETKPEGSRVSIFPVHPGTYFPEFLEGDVTTIGAVKLAESGITDDGKPCVNVLEYRKETELPGPSPIVVSYTQYEPDEWGQPGTDMGASIIKSIAPDERLPDPIDHIPVYHVPNMYDPDFFWGSSEMRGIERLMRGINQAITDEEIALVLEGLGVYVTDAGAPVEETDGVDEEVAWTVAPGRVIELPTGSDFKRVTGVGSVSPYLDHIRYLHQQIDETTGNNDITAGRVDVAVAESGIALALRMGPLLSRMSDKELVVTDNTTQMLYDLRNWFSAYEPLSFDSIRWVPAYGDKLPANKKQQFDQVLSLYMATPVPLISSAEARRMLVNVGFKFSDEGQLVTEIATDMTTSADADAQRIIGGTT